MITVPFRGSSFEWLGVMEPMVVLGLTLLMVLAVSLYGVITEFRTRSWPTKRDLWVTAVAVGVVTFFFFKPKLFFYAFPFGTALALVPGLAAYLAEDHPSTAGLLPAIVAGVLPLGQLAGWWDQCHCPLGFLVLDPPWSVVTLFVVPNLSIGLLSYAAGLGARRLFSAQHGRKLG